MITQERLKEVLYYDQVTGLFVWIAGSKIAGGADERGYIRIRIDGKKYRAHRLAFLYMTGEMPIEVDHKDTVTSNNRWNNLRIANRSNNCRNTKKYKNNKSGHKGVYWHKKRQLWVAKIKVNNKTAWLGEFRNKEDAINIRKSVTPVYHGEFARLE